MQHDVSEKPRVKKSTCCTTPSSSDVDFQSTWFKSSSFYRFSVRDDFQWVMVGGGVGSTFNTIGPTCCCTVVNVLDLLLGWGVGGIRNRRSFHTNGFWIKSFTTCWYLDSSTGLWSVHVLAEEGQAARSIETMSTSPHRANVWCTGQPP